MSKKILGALGLVVAVSPIAISISCGGKSVGSAKKGDSEEIETLRQTAKETLPQIPQQPEDNASSLVKDSYAELLHVYETLNNEIDKANSEEELVQIMGNGAKEKIDAATLKYYETRVDEARKQALRELPSLPQQPSQTAPQSVKDSYAHLVELLDGAKRKINGAQSENDIISALDNSKVELNTLITKYTNDLIFTPHSGDGAVESIDLIRQRAKSSLPALPSQPEADATQVSKDYYAELLSIHNSIISKIDAANSNEEIAKAITDSQSALDAAKSKFISNVDREVQNWMRTENLATAKQEALSRLSIFTSTDADVIAEINAAKAKINAATTPTIIANIASDEVAKIQKLIDVHVAAEALRTAHDAALLKLNAITNKEPEIVTAIEAAKNRINSATTADEINQIIEEELPKINALVRANTLAPDPSDPLFETKNKYIDAIAGMKVGVIDGQRYEFTIPAELPQGSILELQQSYQRIQNEIRKLKQNLINIQQTGVIDPAKGYSPEDLDNFRSVYSAGQTAIAKTVKDFNELKDMIDAAAVDPVLIASKNRWVTILNSVPSATSFSPKDLQDTYAEILRYKASTLPNEAALAAAAQKAFADIEKAKADGVEGINTTFSQDLIDYFYSSATSKIQDAINAYKNLARDLKRSPVRQGFWVANDNAEIEIGNPLAKTTLEQSDIISNIWDCCRDWSHPYTIYPVRLPHSTHTINFAFENLANWTREDAERLIKTWAANVNYGYSSLTLDHVVITTQRLYANGGDQSAETVGLGGAGKDILINSPDLNHGQTGHPDPVLAMKEMQSVYLTLIHEFGHHETLTLIDSHGDTQARDLVAHNVIGSTMYSNTATNPDAEKARMTAVLGTRTFRELMEPIFGAPYHSNGIVSASFLFNMAYHMGAHAEFLNRVMNIVELSALDQNHLAGMYDFIDLIKYQIGEVGRKILNDDLTYTDEVKKLVDLYGQFVYGYATYGLKCDGYTLKGYSNVDIDFAKGTVVGSTNPFVVKVDKVESHFITRDRLFGPITIVNHSYAFNAEVITGPTTGLSSLEFYQDSNHNGVLDESDAKVDPHAQVTLTTWNDGRPPVPKD